MFFCDECRKPAKVSISLETGRVKRNGKDAGQFVSLCDEHRPNNNLPSQPTNCTKISFHWPGL